MNFIEVEDSVMEVILAKSEHILAERLKKSSSDQVAQWLIEGFRTNRFEGLILGSELPLPIQISDLAKYLDESQKAKLRASVNNALNMWMDEHAKNLSLLDDLMALATTTHAVEVLQTIEKIITSSKVQKTYNHNEYASIMVLCAQLLSKFSDSSYAIELMRRLLESAKEDDYQHTVYLFLGLCKADPDHYAKYFNRFNRFLQLYPDHYSIFFIFSNFADHVPTRQLVAHRNEIPEKDRVDLEVYLRKANAWNALAAIQHKQSASEARQSLRQAPSRIGVGNPSRSLSSKTITKSEFIPALPNE